MASFHQIAHAVESWVSKQELYDLAATNNLLVKSPIDVQRQIMDYDLPNAWGAFRRDDSAGRHAKATRHLLHMVFNVRRANMANDLLDGLDFPMARHKSTVLLSRDIEAAGHKFIVPSQYTRQYGYAMNTEDPYFFANRKETVPKISQRVVGLTMQYIDWKQYERDFVFPKPGPENEDIVPWDPNHIFTQHG